MKPGDTNAMDRHIEVLSDRHAMHRRIDELKEGDTAVLVTLSGANIGTDLFGANLSLPVVVGMMEVAQQGVIREGLQNGDDVDEQC